MNSMQSFKKKCLHMYVWSLQSFILKIQAFQGLHCIVLFKSTILMAAFVILSNLWKKHFPQFNNLMWITIICVGGAVELGVIVRWKISCLKVLSYRLSGATITKINCVNHLRVKLSGFITFNNRSKLWWDVRLDTAIWTTELWILSRKVWNFLILLNL